MLLLINTYLIEFSILRFLGMAIISYVVFVLGVIKILPFTEITIFITIFSFLIFNILISKYLNIFKIFLENTPLRRDYLSCRSFLLVVYPSTSTRHSWA